MADEMLVGERFVQIQRSTELFQEPRPPESSYYGGCKR